MAFLTAELFARRHGGFEALARFVDMVQNGCPECQRRNPRPRCKLRHIAREFGLSTSEICQLRKALMRQVWEPEEGLKNYLELHRLSARREYKEKETVILRLQGGQAPR